VLSCTPIKQTYSVPRSCNLCKVRTKTSNVPGIVISQTDDGPSSLQAKYCHQNRFVHSTNSWLTPVKHNTNTIKRLLSMAINWTHFPTFLGAPVSDQDRAAQVAPNIASPHYATYCMPFYRHLIYWGIFSEFIKRWSNSFCTLHTNLHCKTNDKKIWNTTAYPHGHVTFLLRHENTSAAEKTNNPNQMWEQQNMKRNYCCIVASLSVTYLSTGHLKCYTTVAFHFLQI